MPKIELKEETVEDAFKAFLTAKKAEGIAQKTVATYSQQFHRVCEFLDEEGSISLVTTHYIRQVIAAIAGTGISPNSVRSYTAFLKSFFSWCNEEGLCNVNVQLYKGRETVPETYTEDELRMLLKPPKKGYTFSELRGWVIVNVLIDTGMRAGTLRMIQNRDINLDGRCFITRHSKTRQIYTIPMSDQLASVLQKWISVRKGKPEDFCFCSVEGGMITENTLRHIIMRYNTSRGVEKTGIHAFRHTFARMYLIDGNGESLKLQRILGHSTLDMTKRYARIFNRDVCDDFQERSPLEHLQQKKKLRV